MDSFKKQGLLEICITAVKVLLYIMLVFNGFVFIYYGFINQSHPIEHEAVLFINDFSVSYTESGDQSVSSVLPEDIKDNEYFFFDTRKDVDVYINGEKRADLDKTITDRYWSKEFQSGEYRFLMFSQWYKDNISGAHKSDFDNWYNSLEK